jgi:hypothetical protein
LTHINSFVRSPWPELDLEGSRRAAGAFDELVIAVGRFASRARAQFILAEPIVVPAAFGVTSPVAAVTERAVRRSYKDAEKT